MPSDYQLEERESTFGFRFSFLLNPIVSFQEKQR